MLRAREDMKFYGNFIELGDFCQNLESNDVFQGKIVQKQEKIFAS